MQLIKPHIKTTDHSPDCREWEPASFDSLISEMDHVEENLDGTEPFPLYRGQINFEWLLDCTFVRNCVTTIFKLPHYLNLNSEIRKSMAFHKSVASLLYLKFSSIGKPSSELMERQIEEPNTDPWYEFLKHVQQYPEKDKFINGSFLIDWTSVRDIALYFAIYEGKGSHRTLTKGDGAVWLYDALSTGKTYYPMKMEKIIERMSSSSFFEAENALPMIFHPQSQTDMPRAANQKPVYISQMDYRLDLASIWYQFEQENQKRVFVKFIIKEEIKPAIADYLESIGVTESTVYPE